MHHLKYNKKAGGRMKTRHLRVQILMVTFAVLAFGLTNVLSALGADERSTPAKAQAQPPASQPAAPGVNGITQIAVKSGCLSCTSRINQVANFLTAGSQGVGGYFFIPSIDPDQTLVSVSLEIEPPSPPSSVVYASASFAPNQANGCGALYETVVYWPQACNEVANQHYSTLKRTGVLTKSILILEGVPSTRIFLMPAGTGCISIKKELVK
jgi:hypothetical protein